MSDSHGSVSGGSTRVPVFDHKDNARTKQDRWHYFVRQSLAYVESSMVTHCKFDGSKPEFWDFSWILQDKAVQWESVLLDLVKLENSFTNSWSAYRNNMMTGYYNATAADLQFLWCSLPSIRI